MRKVLGSHSKAPLNPGSGSTRERGSVAQYPACTDSSRAASPTFRAMGPSVLNRANQPKARWSGTRPMEGRKPTTLQKPAGLRNEPPMSLPSAMASMPVAKATAAPPLLPPAVLSKS